MIVLENQIQENQYLYQLFEKDLGAKLNIGIPVDPTKLSLIVGFITFAISAMDSYQLLRNPHALDQTRE